MSEHLMDFLWPKDKKVLYPTVTNMSEAPPIINNNNNNIFLMLFVSIRFLIAAAGGVGSC
jgi:hypothetical protein